MMIELLGFVSVVILVCDDVFLLEFCLCVFEW